MRKASLLILTPHLFSCNNWSKSDSSKFLEQCEKTKWEKEFCDCAVEKVKSTYVDFSEISDDEKKMSAILFSCLEEKNK